MIYQDDSFSIYFRSFAFRQSDILILLQALHRKEQHYAIVSK